MTDNKNTIRNLSLFVVFLLFVYLISRFYNKKVNSIQENKNWVYDPHLFIRRALVVNDQTYFRMNITKRKQTFPFADINLMKTVYYAEHINLDPRTVFKFSDYQMRYGFDFYKRLCQLIKSYDVRYLDENDATGTTKRLIGFPPIKLELKNKDDKETLYFSLLVGIENDVFGSPKAVYNTIDANHLYVTGRENEVYVYFMDPRKRNGSFYMCFDVYKIESPNDLSWLDLGGFLQPFSVNYKAYNFSKEEREHNSKKN